MSKKFVEYSGLDLPKINKSMLERWEKLSLFDRSVTEREGAPSFVFYEGPPSANGMPGIHHVMARTIKDTFCRYKTMKGFQVMRKAGWDTHGLPVELGVERSLGITKEDIGSKISVGDYNAACRKEVMKYTKQWENLTHQMGYWIDMKDPYITYDNRYIETLWWLLSQLYNKGLLYKGYTIQPYSPAAGSGLSTHELNQPGCYKDVKDTTLTAQFAIKHPTAEMAAWGAPYLLAWTTTPWTLPSNTALCVGKNIIYSLVHSFNPYTGAPISVILAKDLLGKYFNDKAAELELTSYNVGDKLIPWRVAAEYKGEQLVGMEYEQLLPWVSPGAGAFRVISGDFVTTEDGTGIVHIAPTFGADDAKVAKIFDIPGLMLLDRNGNQRPMVDLTGKFFRLEDLDPSFVADYVNVSLYKEYAGRYVKNAYDPALTEEDTTLDIDICVLLKQENRAFKIEKHVHNYPHCWRTDKPVLYYPLDSWFIKSTACRERMVELNNEIGWKPASTGTGRFGKWLENLQDWNLSRSRYWGTPLPIWRTEDGAEQLCIGSVEQLYSEMQRAIEAGVMSEIPYEGFEVGNYSKENYEKIDLHRPYVDHIVLVSPSGKPMRRESDLIDVWFDSGAMPYAQIHYPFENKEAFDNGSIFPADFISEGVDQTRGWFFTLHAIATMIFDSKAFKNVVSNGLVLDKNGNKMSKRLGNGVDPFESIDKHGSDPLRWYMMTNASPWDNLKFDIEGIEEVRRKFFGTLYNTYSFMALYANVDGFTNQQPQVPLADRPEIDRWILSLLNTLISQVNEAYSDYEPTKAGRMISEFVNDHLSNWYVRLNRKRFWGGGLEPDKLSAYQTLYSCLETVARLMAPIAPFYSDRLYIDLMAAAGVTCDSVHLTRFPEADLEVIDVALEQRMGYAQDISSMVLALRRKVNIKVRQPLSSLMIPLSNEQMERDIELVKDLILSEVNVKTMRFVGNASGVLIKRVKPDFKKLGPRYGKIMKSLAAELQQISQSQIAELETSERLHIEIEGADVEILLTDVEIISEDIPGWLVANEGSLTVALDVTITQELQQEGLARELINRIQNIRKSNGFEITDKIQVEISSHELINATLQHYAKDIAMAVLADDIRVVEGLVGSEIELDDFSLQIVVKK